MMHAAWHSADSLRVHRWKEAHGFISMDVLSRQGLWSLVQFRQPDSKRGPVALIQPSRPDLVRIQFTVLYCPAHIIVELILR